MTADVPTDALNKKKQNEARKNPSQSCKMEGDFALDHDFLPNHDATGEYPNETSDMVVFVVARSHFPRVSFLRWHQLSAGGCWLVIPPQPTLV